MTIGELIAVLKVDASDALAKLGLVAKSSAATTEAIQAQSKKIDAALSGAFTGSAAEVRKLQAHIDTLGSAFDRAQKSVQLLQATIAATTVQTERLSRIELAPSKSAGLMLNPITGETARAPRYYEALTMRDQIVAANADVARFWQMMGSGFVLGPGGLSPMQEGIGRATGLGFSEPAFAMAMARLGVVPESLQTGSGAIDPSIFRRVDPRAARMTAVLEAEQRARKDDLRASSDRGLVFDLRGDPSQHAEKFGKLGQSVEGVTPKVKKLTNAFMDNRNAMFNIGMGLSPLSDAFGRAGQQVLTTAIIAASLTPALAGITVAIVATAAVFAAFVVNLNAVTDATLEATEAARGFNLGPIEKQASAAAVQLERWVRLRESGFIGASIARFSQGFSGFFGDETPEQTRGRASASARQIVPALGAQTVDRAAASLLQAEVATARFAKAQALLANDVDAAAFALAAEIRALDESAKIKLRDADRTSEMERARIRNTGLASDVTDALVKAEVDAHKLRRAEIVKTAELEKSKGVREALLDEIRITRQVAHENSQVAAAYVQASQAAAQLNIQIGLEAANYDAASRARERAINLMLEELDVRVRDAEVEAEARAKAARLLGNEGEALRVEANLRKSIQTLVEATNTSVRGLERSFEHAEIASRSFFTGLDAAAVQRAARVGAATDKLREVRASPMGAGFETRTGLEAGLGLIELDKVQEGTFRRQLARIEDLRAVEERFHAARSKQLAEAKFPVERQIAEELERHRDKRVELGAAEAEALERRLVQAKEHSNRVIEVFVQAQDVLVKAVDRAQDAQSSALESALRESGQTLRAAEVSAGASARQAANERIRALDRVNEAVRAGKLDEERAAHVRVAINEEASAKVVAARLQELRAVREILGGLAAAEAGVLAGVPGAPQLGRGLSLVDQLRKQIVGAREGLRAGQELGFLSKSDADEAGKRYAEAFELAVKQAQRQFGPQGFGKAGEPAVVRLLDSLKRDLRGGFDAAAASSSSFGLSLRGLEGEINQLNGVVDASSARWQGVVDQFGSQIPAAIAASQGALASLRLEIDAVIQRLANLEAWLTTVAASGPAAVTAAGQSAGAPQDDGFPGGFASYQIIHTQPTSGVPGGLGSSSLPGGMGSASLPGGLPGVLSFPPMAGVPFVPEE